MRHREAQFRSGAAWPVPPTQNGGLRNPIARKAEGKAHLWVARTAVPHLFRKGGTTKGPTGSNLMVTLERRLDNVVYRMGLAGSRSQARQLVLHGHIRVKGHKVNIPSYLVQVGEDIALKEKMHQNTMVLEARNLANSQGVAPWLDIDRENFKARVVAMPRREDVQTPPMNEQLIVELYSK